MASGERDIERFYSTDQVVAKLRRLADALEQDKPFRIQIAGERIRVPQRAEFSIEHERGDDEEEIEFQLKWPTLSESDDERRGHRRRGARTRRGRPSGIRPMSPDASARLTRWVGRGRPEAKRVESEPLGRYFVTSWPRTLLPAGSRRGENVASPPLPGETVTTPPLTPLLPGTPISYNQSPDSS